MGGWRRAHARPPAARDASESGDAAAPSSSLSAAVTRASKSASAGARGMVLGQTPAALPATTSPDAEARQSSLPAMAACLGTGALDGEMRTTPRVSPPPAALAAPLANAVCNALVPQPAQGGWCWAKPRPLCLQQHPRTLKHVRAACRPWLLVWERAPWTAK
jgi:hypothetical protein